MLPHRLYISQNPYTKASATIYWKAGAFFLFAETAIGLSAACTQKIKRLHPNLSHFMRLEGHFLDKLGALYKFGKK